MTDSPSARTERALHLAESAIVRTVQAGRRTIHETPERGEPADLPAATLAPLPEYLDERPAAAGLPAWPSITASAPERTAERPAPRSPQRSRRRSPSDPRARVRALVQAADERGERLTGAEVARALGRSPQRTRALLAEVRALMPSANGGHRG
jgi:hypothetical protein